MRLMPTFRRSARIRDITRAEVQGRACYARGDLAGAIERYQAGCGLIRTALATQPADQDGIEQLGAMLYTLGQWQIEALEYADATTSLDEAEQTYARLGERAAGLIADVLVRRAIANMQVEMALSAITDVQHAVIKALGWGEQDPEAREPDVARVMALASHVLLRIGADPDLAVGAADWAMDTYVRLFVADGAVSLPDGHGFAFKLAAEVSAIVHAATSDDLAGPMLTLALAAHGGSWPEFDGEVERVRAALPTIAQVLTAANEADLAKRITASADFVPLVPEMRCQPEMAPAVAVKLTEIRRNGVSDPARILLGLESHALFAAASRLQVPRMRYQFADFGVIWAAELLDLGRLMADQGNTTAAYDAIRWLGGLIDQLRPYTGTDPTARLVVVESARWMLGFHTTTGSSGELAQVLRSLLESLE
jgi:hypothetical protein